MAKKKKQESYPHAHIYQDNTFIRTYSKEVHGDEYLILAETFASKKPDYTIQYDSETN